MPNGSDMQTETRAVYISANTLSEHSNSVGELYTREHLLTCFLNPFSQLPTFREIRLQACKRLFIYVAQRFALGSSVKLAGQSLIILWSIADSNRSPQHCQCCALAR